MQLNKERELLELIEKLKRSKVRSVVESRAREFKEIGEKASREVFKELCFCILCANYTAERGMKIQATVGDGFLTLSELELAQRLRSLGHRFPNTRARFIVEARMYMDSLKEIIGSFGAARDLREWLIFNVKGIGPKEASHFLRNIGYTDFAILDFHIVNVLTRHGLIEKPKTLTKRKYLEIEDLLGGIARKAGLDLAELDLYLWYLETGRILK